jgi:hypothetical protein
LIAFAQIAGIAMPRMSIIVKAAAFHWVIRLWSCAGKTAWLYPVARFQRDSSNGLVFLLPSVL